MVLCLIGTILGGDPRPLPCRERRAALGLDPPSTKQAKRRDAEPGDAEHAPSGFPRC